MTNGRRNLLIIRNIRYSPIGQRQFNENLTTKCPATKKNSGVLSFKKSILTGCFRRQNNLYRPFALGIKLVCLQIATSSVTKIEILYEPGKRSY